MTPVTVEADAFELSVVQRVLRDAQEGEEYTPVERAAIRGFADRLALGSIRAAQDETSGRREDAWRS